MPVYSINKKVKFDYEILDTVEAGLILTGNETKSIRTGHVSLQGGFVSFYKNEAYLANVNIPKYKYSGSLKDYESQKNRKLLLNKKEIGYLKGKTEERGLTIVPLSLYTKGRLIKLEIAVVRGKKKYDKRRTIKKRELDRETRRVMKDH